MTEAKAHFHATTDTDHHHGSFVGQYCQGQAQEITVEVILCKYSRQLEGDARLARARELGSGVVYSERCARRHRRCGERQVFNSKCNLIFPRVAPWLVVARKLTTS